MSESDFRRILDAFLKVIPNHVSDYASGALPVVFPVVSSNMIQLIFIEAMEIMRRERNVLELSGDTIIVGDLHGHVLDLYRILIALGLPGRKKFLFLGDLVDRGEFSVETVLIVFLLKVIWPNHVFLIRGNHEFDSVCQTGGFKSEFMGRYNSEETFDRIISAFDFMPLAAIVDRTILCVHGGFGPELQSIDQIRALSRPIHDFGNVVLDGILWSDPKDGFQGFEKSCRGIGWHFGYIACRDLTTQLNVKIIIRAHECVCNGYQPMFGGLLATLFSASNYCGAFSNKSAIVRVQNGKISPIKFESLPYLKRDKVRYATGAPVAKQKAKKKICTANRNNKENMKNKENKTKGFGSKS
jgi:protein phosphatase